MVSRRGRVGVFLMGCVRNKVVERIACFIILGKIMLYFCQIIKKHLKTIGCLSDIHNIEDYFTGKR